MTRIREEEEVQGIHHSFIIDIRAEVSILPPAFIIFLGLFDQPVNTQTVKAFGKERKGFISCIFNFVG